MFTIVHPIVTQSTHLHLVSFCEADTSILPNNIPLISTVGIDNIVSNNGYLIPSLNSYYQIFASTDPTLGVPPMSDSFLKKYEQDNRDMEEVLLYWEQKDGESWTPFVHPRKGHVIINSLEKAPQVGQMVYFSEKTYDGFLPIIEIWESKDPITLPQHKYGVKFDNPSDFLDYHTLLQKSKSFHP